jgi:tRNA ligase
VISQFFGSFEEVETDEADDVIDMEYDETLEQAVRRALVGLCPILELDMPEEDKIVEACGVARAYTVKRLGKKAAAPKPPRYFAFVPKIDLEQFLDEKMRGKDVPESGTRLWTLLVEGHRLPDNPHVTLIHTKEKHEAEKLWELCTALRKTMPESEATFQATFEHVVWNENVMALAVTKLEMRVEAEGEHGEVGRALIENIADNIKGRLHLTVGTREDGINAFEAAGLVGGWRRGEGNGAQSISLGKCVIEGRIMGRYN